MLARDPEVRAAVYRLFLDLGRAPVPFEIGDALGMPQAEVEASLHRLAAERQLVLAPGTPYVWMANPLSALPTPFRVEASGRTWFGNCIWDALGIVAMLGGDGVVRTRCPDCEADLVVEVADGELVRPVGAVRFAVPACHWWDDIGFN